MSFIKVEGHDDLVRDEKTNAIVNTNSMEYKKYIEAKSAMAARRQQINNQTEEIRQLKQEVSELKSLLTELLRVSRDANTSSTDNSS